MLADGATSEWSQVFKATPFVVTPAPVVFTDMHGTKDDTYTILSLKVLSTWLAETLSLQGRTRAPGR
ncbi:hypothetical protein D3C73_1583360 [compost metagenome]